MFAKFWILIYPFQKILQNFSILFYRERKGESTVFCLSVKRLHHSNVLKKAPFSNNLFTKVSLKAFPQKYIWFSSSFI